MTLVGAYFAQRFPISVFGPVVALIAGAALWSVESASGTAATRALALSALLVTQFRIWDDLRDRERDRRTHPERILTRASVGPFRAICAALSMVSAILCLASPPALAVLVATNAAFWFAYDVLRPQIPDTTWQFGVLPAKYPAFLCIAGPAIGVPSPGRLAMATLVAYLAAIAYEYWHHAPATAGVSR